MSSITMFPTWGEVGWPKQDVFNGTQNPGKGHISTPPGISGPTIIPSHFCSVSGSQNTGQKFGQLFMGPMAGMQNGAPPQGATAGSNGLKFWIPNRIGPGGGPSQVISFSAQSGGHNVGQGSPSV